MTDAVPSKAFPVYKDLSQEERLAVLNSAVREIISKFVDISFPGKRKSKSKKVTTSCNHVLEYAKKTLTMGLMLLEFKNAVREGDGERVQ